MKKIKRALFASLVAAAVVMNATNVTVYADDGSPWTFGAAVTFPQSAGETKDTLKNGFGFDMNTSWQPSDSILGVRLDGSYSGFNLTDSTLNKIGEANSGYANVWGLGLNALVAPKGDKKLKPRLYAGPGFYYQYAEASEYVNGQEVCDPWWGCYPAYTTGNYVHRSTSRLGWQGGVGLDYNFDMGGALSLDLQYVSINNTQANTEYMPINIGYTWHFQ